MQKQPQLEGRFYLVVEDEYLTASSLVIALEDSGAVVAGPVSNVAGALQIVSERGGELDAAILDINLRGSMAYPVAEKLLEAHVPFIFVTGYECGSMPLPFEDIPCLNKPCDEDEILRHLAAFTERKQPAGDAVAG